MLSQNAKDALDEMATAVEEPARLHRRSAGLLFWTRTDRDPNSQKMAESVVRYLVLNHDIPVYRIYLVGMGNAPVQPLTSDAKPSAPTAAASKSAC